MVKGTTTNPDIDFNKPAETPLFGQGNDNFAQAITEAGIKAAKATHEFKMREIRAQMLADCVTKLIEKAPTFPTQCNLDMFAEYAQTLVELTIDKM